MSWWPLYAKRTVSSEKNGLLKVVTWLGKTAVIGGGVFQSGPYMQSVFRGMLRMLPRSFVPKHVLVVGLGAGGCVPVIQKRFPWVHVVALEYDEVMVALARQTYLKQANVGSVEVVLGDIRETLPRLSMEFDLILVDVFCGSRVAPALSDEEVLEALKRLLSFAGYLIVNCYRERELVTKLLERFFSAHRFKRIESNDIGLYRHEGMGKQGEAVPAGFQDRAQSRAYLETMRPNSARCQIIEDSGGLHLRSILGPFSFEPFVQASEPALRPDGKVRIISWQPYQGGYFSGWWRIPFPFSTPFKKGVAVLGQAEYWKDWSSHAKRHRKKFLQDDRYEIVEVDLATFAAAYRESKHLGPLTRRAFVGVLKAHLAVHSQDVHLTVAKEASSKRILSGLATIDYPPISQSTHVIAFVHPDAQGSSAGVGLIDQWFGRCLRERIRFLNFGVLRGPHDPRSWQGYTDFKRQFHLHEILYPKPVFRIVLPKRGVL
ncbi:methyltransferase domain-containing protein [Candidatus Uhrbacteria bacterium]|nr:methyltransferase domain-containing protein [Candidatus Uhrbacteria bacterium]